MKFNLDFNRDGFIFPHKRIEKMFALAGYLFERHTRCIATLAENLDKSEEQIRRDLKSLSEFYDIKWDSKNNPFINTPELKKKNEYHQLIELLQGEQRFTLPELATRFGVSQRTIQRHLETIEKFFDMDYDFEDRPFIFK